MKTQPEIVEQTYVNAQYKCNSKLSKQLLNSFLAGAYLSMGCALAVVVGFGFPELSAANPGLSKLLFGLAFPIGLAMIMLLGAELFTGNTATLIPALIDRRVTWAQVLRNWLVVWCGNFIGALFFAYVLVYLTGIIGKEPWLSGLNNYAEAKVSYPFIKTMLKGVAANWFVCLAVWMSLGTGNIRGKVVAIWIPISAFVILGYEHSIANMFFLPMAMFNGAEISTADLFIKNLIPVTIGNIIGGALFVGTLFTYLHAKRS